MELDPELLRRLHRIQKQLEDLNDRIARGPRQMLACETDLKKAKQGLADAQETQKQTRLLADERQLLMGTREAKIAKMQTNLNTADSNKQFQLLKDQIAAEEQANEVLADEIFELLERIDTEAELINQAKKQVEVATAALNKIEEKVSTERTLLDSELARVKAEQVDAEKEIPGNFRENYNRLVNAKGADAMAQVDGNCCGGCYQTLSPQIFNNLHLGKPVYCNSCGCVMYLPEGTKVR